MRRSGRRAIGLGILLVVMVGANQSWAAPSSWTIQISESPGSLDNLFEGVTVPSSTNAWAVGEYADSDGVYKTLIEHYNGTAWAVQSSPNIGFGYNNFLHAVKAASSSNVWAVGDVGDEQTDTATWILHYDGTSWELADTPNPRLNLNNLYGVSVASSQAWAVGWGGRLQGPGETPPAERRLDPGPSDQPTARHTVTIIEHYDGLSWAVQTSRNPGVDENYLWGTSAQSSSDVWAAGWYVGTDGISRTLIEHYDGTSWKKAVAPSPGANGNGLYGISANSASDVWAVGTDYPGATARTLILHNDGTSWKKVPSPNSSGEDNVLFGVKAVSSSNVWAVGYHRDQYSGALDALILHYDGTAWKIQQTSPGEAALYGVGASSSANAFAVGTYYSQFYSLQSTLVMHCC